MKEEIFRKIKEYETIIIHRHVRPDPDAYGSQGGLAELIKQSFPNKRVLVVGEEEESLGFLNQMDHISDKSYDHALVIVCDTANQARVSDQRYVKGEFLIKIDHHPNEDPYGDLLWVDTSFSSTSEMIYEFYLDFKDHGLTLSTEAARLIYAGIVGDTGRFLFPSTEPKTFRYSADLIETGFNFSELYNELYKTKVNVAHLNGFILQNFSMTDNGAAYVKLDKTTLEKYEATASNASQLVGTLGNIEGILAWVMFVEESDQIRVRLRSKGPIVNTIAANYGGGGHPLAAGASIHSWEEMNNVLNDLNEACKKFAK